MREWVGPDGKMLWNDSHVACLVHDTKATLGWVGGADAEPERFYPIYAYTYSIVDDEVWVRYMKADGERPWR
eukprot:gene11695-8099_t